MSGPDPYDAVAELYGQGLQAAEALRRFEQRLRAGAEHQVMALEVQRLRLELEAILERVAAEATR